jgi:hypothetical protein
VFNIACTVEPKKNLRVPYLKRDEACGK